MKYYLSSSPRATKRFSGELARKILKGGARRKKRRGALVIALSGDLGTGKTTFIQGFLRGLGVKKNSTSPTFIIFRRFALKFPRFARLYHFDAYRIKKPRELLALGFKGILSDSKNIVVVEWADKVKRILPKNALKLRFEHGQKENERRIRFLL